MRYISLFSGIEAASVAWEDLGWEAVAFSEIEPFPCELLKQRYPDVPNLGDITKIDWSEYAGNVDIVVGGSPCQSFSIAGSRTGLAGESGLMFEYIRAVREVMPRCFIWENVPGALSSEEGRAFGQLLDEVDELGYGYSWRVLDAQFFGAPQRRRRVFLVGLFGNVESAVEVLFERESVCWDYPSSRAKRAELAARAERSSSSRCLRVLPFDPTQITSKQNGNNPQWGDACHPIAATSRPPHVICMADANSKAAIDEDLSGTLKVGGEPPIVSYQNPPEFVVRKLMPIECERLQGFPDGWTEIEFKGKPASDAARYKALGNSMAVPVMRWIGERVQEVLSR